MADFPSHPDAIDPAWLTEALRGAGLISDVAVTAFTWQPVGTGNVGDSVRLNLAYDRPGPWPATLVGKFPAADPTSRATAAAFGVYAREVRFYQEVAPALAVRVPEAYVARMAPDGVDFILLFEDLGPARGGDQLASCTPMDARAAIRQLAAIHAPSWSNAELLATPWLQSRPEGLARRAELYRAALPVVRDRLAGRLEPEFMSVCEALGEAIGEAITCESRPCSLVHGDFRLDNMLFDIKGGAEEIAVLDWQTVAVGNGLTDLGYFLGTGIGDRLRRAHEAELLELYCAEMTRRGVPLTRAEIWDDYVIGAMRGIVNAVISIANVKRSPRGDDCFLSMARGGCALALQHDSIGKLKGRGAWS